MKYLIKLLRAVFYREHRCVHAEPECSGRTPCDDCLADHAW